SSRRSWRRRLALLSGGPASLRARRKIFDADGEFAGDPLRSFWNDRPRLGLSREQVDAILFRLSAHDTECLGSDFPHVGNLGSHQHSIAELGVPIAIGEIGHPDVIRSRALECIDSLGLDRFYPIIAISRYFSIDVRH